MKKNSTSLMLSQIYEEHYLRINVKDPDNKEQALQAFRKYMEKNCQIKLNSNDVFCSPPLFEKESLPYQPILTKKKKLDL